MDTVKIIKSGDSQVVKLPNLYRMNVEEVYIKRVSGRDFVDGKRKYLDNIRTVLGRFPRGFFEQEEGDESPEALIG